MCYVTNMATLLLDELNTFYTQFEADHIEPKQRKSLMFTHLINLCFSIFNPAMWLETATCQSQAQINGEEWRKQWQTTPLLLPKYFMEQNQRDSDMVPEGEPPGLESTQQLTREEEEQGRFSSSLGFNDVSWIEPFGLQSADATPGERNCLHLMKFHNFGTWNVCGLNTSKLDIVKAEMERLSIDILGISELHWKGSGYLKSYNYTVYYSGNDNIKCNGVALIPNRKIAKAIQCFNAISDSYFCSLQCKASLTYDLAGLCTHYGRRRRRCRKILWGAPAGDRLIQCCQEHHLLIAKTWFEQSKCRLYMWAAPNGQHRNQIDHFLCQQRWKSSMQAVKMLPDAHCGSDHQLLVAQIKLRFNTIKRSPEIHSKANYSMKKKKQQKDCNGSQRQRLKLPTKDVQPNPQEKALNSDC
uniref:Endonuclease/exonuclease/phosphatase domain-containing protein n=1 Tax=Electrophorus electricus TaxID=8005 RepID=A0A4W4GG74_ELEEL